MKHRGVLLAYFAMYIFNRLEETFFVVFKLGLIVLPCTLGASFSYTQRNVPRLK